MPIFDYCISVADENEHITWMQRIALWLIKNGRKTTHKELMRKFDISYSFATNLMRRFRECGFCKPKEREGSSVKDYVFNGRLDSYAQWFFETRVKPHVGFKWEDFLECHEAGEPRYPELVDADIVIR